MTRRILVTGGAGFVGAHLALRFKRDLADATVIAFDNLKRRGSELALARLAAGGVTFVHGDVRSAGDLGAVGEVALIVECAAEPSVHAGAGDPSYVIESNLGGAINCLEHARRHGADVIFLSTSRVYPIARLRALPLAPQGARLALADAACGPGWSMLGISEDFLLSGARSLYGATKLAAELLIEDYRAAYGLRGVVNRCGVIAGPWQMGQVDQGFVVLWLARHLFARGLTYAGFGGKGLQVRDVLHIDDLADLIAIQAARMTDHDGRVFNVGGGTERSTSLAELTELCQRMTGQFPPIASDPSTRPNDVPYYVSDTSAIRAAGWSPLRSLEVVCSDIVQWLTDHRGALERIVAT